MRVLARPDEHWEERQQKTENFLKLAGSAVRPDRPALSKVGGYPTKQLKRP